MSRQPQAHCHHMIAQVAKEAAGELYDVVMADNVVFTEWKRQNPGCTPPILVKRFIAKNWGKCIPFARATLTRMLTTNIDESLKEQIHEALCLDNTLIRGRTPAPELPSLIKPIGD